MDSMNHRNLGMELEIEIAFPKTRRWEALRARRAQARDYRGFSAAGIIRQAAQALATLAGRTAARRRQFEAANKAGSYCH